MKRFLKIIWYYIEIYFIKLILLLGIKRNSSVIPEGVYCYTPIEFPSKENNHIYKIKPCKYYRHITKNIKSCTYEGYVGFDFGLYDQCKICGENDDISENDLIK
jgi:hypothetical protein